MSLQNDVRDRGKAFGELLRYWRGTRRFSQLDLAMEADVSARHLSFLETGRSCPTRDMVQRLSSVLSLPLREKNDLLTAAGYAATHGASHLDEPPMARFRQAVDRILEKQEPYPALVMDRHWNFVTLNRGARRLVESFLAPETLARFPNAMELLFAPDGLQPFVENWEEVASAMLARIYREHAQSPTDTRLASLYQSLVSGDRVPAAWRSIAATADTGPVLPLVLTRANRRASLFTTITTFGTPNDVMLQELRIEQYFPEDDETRRWLEE